MLKWSLRGVRQEYRVSASVLSCFISPLLRHIHSICFYWLRLIHTAIDSCMATFTAAPFFLFSRLIVRRLTLSVTRRLLWDVKKIYIYLSHRSRCQQVTGSFYSETFMLLLFVGSARLYEMCSQIFACRLCGKWPFQGTGKGRKFYRYLAADFNSTCWLTTVFRVATIDWLIVGTFVFDLGQSTRMLVFFVFILTQRQMLQ